MGRAGEGKITYHQASQIRTLLAWSIRKKDPVGCLYGKCIFREDYELDKVRYPRHAHWALTDGNDSNDPQPLPCEEPDKVDCFKSAFGLHRKTDEMGTSFIIPYPHESLDKMSLTEALVSEFFYTILNGSLIVEICGESIDANTIEHHLPASEIPSKKYFDFVKTVTQKGGTCNASLVPAWQKGNTIDDEMFFPSELEPLKEKFELGELVGVKMPITLYPKNEKETESHISVFLQCNDDLVTETEELFIRSDLQIGEEKKLKNSPGRVFGLCTAADEPISDFLGHAEEASHLKWNAQDEEVNERYDKVGESLNNVRQGPVRLYKFLKGMNKGVQEDKFLDILSIPGTIKKKKQKKIKSDVKIVFPGPPTPPPPPSKKTFYLKDTEAGTIEICKGDEILEDFPVSGKMQLAYARMAGDGDAFGKYHPFDFDLGSAEITYDCEQIKITSAELNIVEFEVEGPDFSLKIGGFNPNQQIRSKASLLVR